MRTLLLLLAAIGTVAEALAVGGALYVLGAVIGDYSMSMNGLSAARGQVAVWVLAVVLAAVLAAPAVPLVLAAVRRRTLGRPARALIVGALAVQAVLGLVAGLAFSELAVVAVLAVFSLLLSALLAGAAPDDAERHHGVLAADGAERHRTGPAPAA